MKAYDAIVLGIGGMGSAATYQLARRGQRVLGLERFDIPHNRGSSHGATRIIRLAYYEHPSYVPLLRRAYELWRELERGAGEQLLYITGSIDAGPADSPCFEGSRRSCELHRLPHELLNGAQVNERFPGYRLPEQYRAVLQPEGGFVLPERCIVAHVEAAQEAGAEVRARERVLEWEPRGDRVRVTTDKGVYEAGRLLLTAGAWSRDLLPSLRELAVPERQVLAWFQPRQPDLYRPSRFPVFNLQLEDERFYGLPIFGQPGLKVGRYHHREERGDADQLSRECGPEDEALLRSFVERYLPAAAGPTMALATCLFTNSPDEHFIIDTLPGLPQVSIAAGFSGHGYKFCSVVGEILADLLQQGSTQHDVGLFRLDRFAR